MSYTYTYIYIYTYIIYISYHTYIYNINIYIYIYIYIYHRRIYIYKYISHTYTYIYIYIYIMYIIEPYEISISFPHCGMSATVRLEIAIHPRRSPHVPQGSKVGSHIGSQKSEINTSQTTLNN